MRHNDETGLNRWLGLLVFIAILWVVELANLVLGHGLNGFGLLPRSLRGLAGIFTAPFLHSGVGHLSANTAGLLVLGGIASLRGSWAFAILSVQLALLSGAAVWCCARAGMHVGASGLIFGYFGFLLARGWYERTPAAIVTAVVVIFLYGGIVWGVLPAGANVSWEGHLFGLLAGILLARLGAGTAVSR